MSHLLSLVCALTTVAPLTIAIAADPVTPPTTTSPAAGSVVWLTDMEQAKAQAKAERKDLLVVFTGSDWCPPCKMLKKTIFMDPEFATITSDFVLVELDFPRSIELPDEQKAHNDRWSTAWEINSYPTVILADDAAMPYASAERPPSPKAYVAAAKDQRGIRTQRDGFFAAAASATTAASRAQLLDKALTVMGEGLIIGQYRKQLDQIMAADADDSLGLRAKYAEKTADLEIAPLLEKIGAIMDADATRFAEAIALLSQAGAEPNQSKAVQWRLLAIKANILHHSQQPQAEVLAALDAAIALTGVDSDQRKSLMNFRAKLAGKNAAPKTK